MKRIDKRGERFGSAHAFKAVRSISMHSETVWMRQQAKEWLAIAFRAGVRSERRRLKRKERANG